MDNTNNSGGDNGMGMGLIIGLLIVIVVLGLFFAYGWPAIKGDRGGSDANINIQVPTGDNGGTPPSGDTGGSGGAELETN